MSRIQKITNWYFSKATLPYWCVLFYDSALVVFAYILAFYFTFGGNGITDHFWLKVAYMALVTAIYMAFFKLKHTYNVMLRLSTFSDLTNIALAILYASITTAIIRALFFEESNVIFPCHRVIFIASILAGLILGCARMITKVAFDAYLSNRNASPIYIYGAREAAMSLARALQANKTKYKTVAFISPEKDEQNLRLGNIQVLRGDKDIYKHIEMDRIKAIMISPLYAEHFRNNKLFIDYLIKHDIKILMPSEEAVWSKDQPLSPNMLHEVNIEDLLPREKIEIDLKAIGALLKGSKILITGAAGSIGSELVRQCAAFEPAEMILIDQAESPMHDIRRMMASTFPDVKAHTIVTSIANTTHMERIFSEHRPDYVLHAAAYKHVPMMEDNPSIAIQNNVYGTRVIADLSVKYGVKKFVMISTDKAVNPTNVMGCSKRICEIYCQSLNSEIQKEDSTIKQCNGEKAVTQFVTTRFGNVLGSNGSVIPIFREQIAKGGPVTVTHPDIIRYFMLISEACRLVLEAGTYGKGGEIFVFDMGQPVKIVNLAKNMIRLSGAKNVEIKFTGLRDGEKLYEEVLNDSEKIVPTHHPKIKIAKVREYEYNEAIKNEQRLYKASFSYDDMEVVKIMKEFVPEFKSNHSKYEKLD